MAATVPVEKAGENQLLDSAQAIGQDVLPGAKTADQPSTSEAKAGSYEQFMAMFGRK